MNDFLFICCQACKFGEGGIYGNHLVRSSGCSKCVPGLYLSDRRRRIKLIIHKNITYDLWVYHDLDLRSFRQEHLQEKCKVCVLSISFFLEEIRSCYFTQSLLLTSGCVMNLTKSQLNYLASSYRPISLMRCRYLSQTIFFTRY